MLEFVEEEPDVDGDAYNDGDGDGDDGNNNGNNDVVFMVVLENEEPPQDGCLADPLGAHHHQLGSVLLQEHGHNHNLPQGVTKSGYETTLYGVC